MADRSFQRGWSPRGLLLRAVILAAAFGVCHLAGLRRYACVLSGTSPTGRPGDLVAAGYGCAYVVLYFASVLVAPILIAAAAIWSAANVFASRDR
jgi:hypothetical protein